jgi:hypothetical protein
MIMQDREDLPGHSVNLIRWTVRIPYEREKDLLIDLLFGELLFEELD